MVIARLVYALLGQTAAIQVPQLKVVAAALTDYLLGILLLTRRYEVHLGRCELTILLAPYAQNEATGVWTVQRPHPEAVAQTLGVDSVELVERRVVAELLAIPKPNAQLLALMEIGAELAPHRANTPEHAQHLPISGALEGAPAIANTPVRRRSMDTEMKDLIPHPCVTHRLDTFTRLTYPWRT